MKNQIAALFAIAILSACGGGSDSPPAPEIKINTAEYSVSGSSGNQAQVTYENSQGGTSQEIVTLPWKKSMFSSTGSRLYISAQSQSSVGSITVAVLINGVVAKSSSSNGAYVIATASTTCCEIR